MSNQRTGRLTSKALKIRLSNIYYSNRSGTMKSGFSLLLHCTALLSPTSQAHPGHSLPLEDSLQGTFLYYLAIPLCVKDPGSVIE